jgi:transcriptional regulator with XRE-family HTH domain
MVGVALSETIGSSVPLRVIGRHLKQAREAANVSILAAANELELSRPRLYRIEAGKAPLRAMEIKTMCSLYEVPPALTDALVNLGKEAKVKGWWHAYGDAIPEWFQLYVGLEAAASHLRWYEQALIPGMFQTEAYATAMFRTRRGITDDEVEKNVGLRMERKRLLRRRDAPTIEIIVDEAAIRRPIPDVEEMRHQLAHLVNTADASPTVSLRILPLTAGASGATAGSFVVLDFPDPGHRLAEPTTVYIEGMTGALYLDKPHEVAAYTHTWDSLCSLALSERDSADLIATVIKESYDD